MRSTVSNLENEIRVDNREELIYLWTEASELEHGLLCCYLFAAFTMKSDASEGLTGAQLDAVNRWKRVIYQIAAQEMLHLSLACNLLTSIGAAPHFRRPNFPVAAKYCPPSFRLSLGPFNERTLSHFIFVERPEGMKLQDAPQFEPSDPAPVAPNEGDEIVPMPQDFATVGHLYRGIEAGLRHLVEKDGEDRVFIGPPRAQASKKYFRLPELIPVTSLASAIKAIETIVEEGEGARGDIEGSHYGRFLRIQAEYRDIKRQDPDFEPARPVVANPYARAPSDAGHVNLVDDQFALQVCNLFDGCYEVMVLMLARFFAHTAETEAELKLLVDTAIDMMFSAIEPIGEYLTTLPAGPSHPGLNAGPGFHFYRSMHVLPHKEAAWVVFHERLVELRDYCGRIAPPEGVPNAIQQVLDSLDRLARKIEGGVP